MGERLASALRLAEPLLVYPELQTAVHGANHASFTLVIAVEFKERTARWEPQEFGSSDKKSEVSRKMS